MSLATKYRPQEFKDVSSQVSTIKILERQIETKTFKNAYLFVGPSGCGKTTLARIFANKINNGKGLPKEIDGASNNGVDNVKQIILEANQRSLESEYKVFIIDECHAISSAGWQAFLKCIEEPPKYTIFIFCTTEVQKVPDTIKNRTIRMNLTKVDTESIKKRLAYICTQEGYTNFEESIDYISKLAQGGMRNGISLLEKCAGYSNDLCITNVLQVLGNFSYETFFDLTNAIADSNQAAIISIIDDVYNKGSDIKLFVDQYLDFVLDLTKYIIFKNMSVTKIPQSLEKGKDEKDTRCVLYTTGLQNAKTYFSKLVDSVLDIKNTIRYDSSMKNTVEVMLLKISRGL